MWAQHQTDAWVLEIVRFIHSLKCKSKQGRPPSPPPKAAATQGEPLIRPRASGPAAQSAAILGWCHGGIQQVSYQFSRTGANWLNFTSAYWAWPSDSSFQ
uniref:Uncharacterized protein n=1 Tax=Sphaerodactylus townsendi TaxID=933632 RepID=A0ACB8F5F8_9SAUR